MAKVRDIMRELVTNNVDNVDQQIKILSLAGVKFILEKDKEKAIEIDYARERCKHFKADGFYQM